MAAHAPAASRPYIHVGIDPIPTSLPPPVLPDPSAPDAPKPFVHPLAVVDEGAVIGNGTRVWHFVHVCKGAVIGGYCNLGQNVYVGPSTSIGNHCKIQNNVSIYDGITIGDQVFLGPSCVFTNDKTPRAVNYGGKWFLTETHVGKGTTIGANATIVCGNTLGEYCTIGAGSTVTHDVKPHAVMVGVPAKQVGWVGKAGFKLDLPVESPADGSALRASCPVSGEVYELRGGSLSLVAEGSAAAAAGGAGK
jgi:UDP-2-acetamido-3-amino-2,3-dideoxy-glucuronate N-acetyltransferase